MCGWDGKWQTQRVLPAKRKRRKHNWTNTTSTGEDSVCQRFCLASRFTHTSTGTLSSRGNTAPSSFRPIRRGSRSSTMVKAVRNTAGRPDNQDWKKDNKSSSLFLGGATVNATADHANIFNVGPQCGSGPLKVTVVKITLHTIKITLQTLLARLPKVDWKWDIKKIASLAKTD